MRRLVMLRDSYWHDRCKTRRRYTLVNTNKGSSERTFKSLNLLKKPVCKGSGYMRLKEAIQIRLDLLLGVSIRKEQHDILWKDIIYNEGLVETFHGRVST